MNKPNIPLVVDLDGTLIRTDLLLESFYAMLKVNPFLIFFVPLWLLRGKSYLKNQIAYYVNIDAASLPYHAEFLEYLRQESSHGRKLVLATASVRKFAQKIADHLKIFTDVLATDEHANLAGKNKLKLLVEKYGEKGFDYAGNAKPDLHIFPHARHAVLVDPPPSVLKIAQKIADVEQVFKSPSANRFFLYFKAIRAYQWVKNILLFIPLIMAHQWSNIPAVEHVILGFIAFSFCASGGYLFNDFLDLTADRNHPRKKKRPFASGNLSILEGSLLMVAIQSVGLGIAIALSWQFFALVVLYIFISLAYTFHLKTYVLIDVLVLAGLYTMRVIVGGVVADVPLSFWLLAFSIFMFFSLALVKRCSELNTLAKTNKEYAGGRDYSISDLDYLREMGIASGYLAIFIVAFYINSPDIAMHYSRPMALWLICPALFYWVSRIWLKTGRGEMTDDPIVFSIKDKGSQFVMVVIVIILLLAI